MTILAPALAVLLALAPGGAATAQAPDKARKSKPDAAESFRGAVVPSDAPREPGAAAGRLPLTVRRGETVRRFVVRVDGGPDGPATVVVDGEEAVTGDVIRAALAAPGREVVVIYEPAPFEGTEAHVAKRITLGDTPPPLPAVSGLQVEELEPGSGAPAQKGDWVTVHYTGWIKDGRKFESSRDDDRPFRFKLGAGTVIKGWDYGIAGMRVGGKRRLVVAQYLAYGSRGSGGNIPPYATLVFEVDLLKIEGKAR